MTPFATFERRLRAVVDGAVYAPGEPGYDDHRRPLSPALDPHPAVVVRAATPADVQAAIAAARGQGVPFAVQATGHGTHVPSDGGVLLDTSAMRPVLVNPHRRIARVGAGARWSQVLAAARPFGLAPLSGSAPSVGVVGYTLGGGMGWLSRRHGLAADSVLRAEVVTADGHQVVASPDHHADLFWALRGGGGNFGVVTALEFKLYPVGDVYGGVAYFPIERAADTLDRYRAWAAAVPDEMSSAVLLTRLPYSKVPESWRGRRAMAIKGMYAGPADDAEKLLRPLRAVAGPALLDGFRSMPFADAAMGGTAPRYFDYVEQLRDGLTDRLLATSATVEIRHWAGAIARPGTSAGPAGHRSAPFSIIVDDADTGTAAQLRPYGLGRTFLNFLSDPRRVATAFSPDDYQRLREVKRVNDPDNVFRDNLNVQPSTALRLAARA